MSLTERMNNAFNSVVEAWYTPNIMNVFQHGFLWGLLFVVVASLIAIFAAASFPDNFIIASENTEIVVNDGSLVIDLRFIGGIWTMCGIDAVILILIAYFARKSLKYRRLVNKWKVFYDEHHPQNT